VSFCVEEVMVHMLILSVGIGIVQPFALLGFAVPPRWYSKVCVGPFVLAWLSPTLTMAISEKPKDESQGPTKA